MATTLLFILVPAGLTAAEATLTDHEYGWSPFRMAVLLSGSFLLTLFIKSLPYYWIFLTAFLAAVGATGVVRWVDRLAPEMVAPDRRAIGDR